VGVVSAGGGENVAFAISAVLSRRVVPALVEDGGYAHPYVGVGLRGPDPPLVRANGFARSTGVYVDRVRENGPAAGVLRGSTG
jgi:S1-C subfamily serine protease